MRTNFNNLIELLQYRSIQQETELAYRYLVKEDEYHDITYAKLYQSSIALAATLQKSLAPNARVLIALDSSLDYIVAFFACVCAGVVSVTAYPPRQPRHLNRLEAIVKDSHASLVLTSSEIINTGVLKQSAVFSQMECLPVDHNYSDEQAAWTLPAITENTVAFLQYTSGSTSTPKGVMVSHANLLHNFNVWHAILGDNALNKCVSWLPIFHDLGLIAGLLLMLYMGKPSVFMAPLTFLKDPMIWLRTISREKGTLTMGPNFAYDLVAKKATPAAISELDLSSLAVAINAAEPVLAETIINFEKVFAPAGLKEGVTHPGYGMAEATLAISIETNKANRIKPISKKALNQQIAGEPINDADITYAISCGVTEPSHQIAIVDPVTRMACAPNIIGEIWFAGPSVALGYLDKKPETQATFKATIKHHRNKRFLRTGDYGFLDEKGLLYVTGRMKDLIIINGKNIYPHDIELYAYKAHPALVPYNCIAFSIPVEHEEQLILVLEAQPQDIDYASIYRKIRDVIWKEFELTIYDIVLIPARTIPKTSSGKLQRKACRAAYLDNKLTIIDRSKNELAKPAIENNTNIFSDVKINELLNWMSAWLAKRLNQQDLKITQETAWHDLGLDSVVVTELMAELSQHAGQALSPAAVWEYDTPYEMLQTFGKPSIHINQQPTSTINNAINMDNAIAIIGMGCRFPNGENLKIFWKNLSGDEDAIKPVSSSRANYLRLMGIHTHGWYGGFIADAEAFDASLFHISPLEANYLDPQHRLALEVAWESLEDAHINPLNLRGTETGVFLGISSHDYDLLMARADLTLEHNLYRLTGTTASTAAGRISYMFGFNGPCKAIDTACSSSLVALHDACVSLQRNECQLALAGGVNLLLAPDLTTSFKNAHMLSPVFRCKTFDKDADGYVRGEGCGWVVLKKLSDAIRDGDRIHGVIRGSAINQDGASQGLTAPNGHAQINVMLKALAHANMQADEIQHVEAHGTGTPLGDPVEWHSINSVYGAAAKKQPVIVSSVKTRIGHLEAAAGIAGLIKTTLALKNRLIPSHLNFFRLNPNCDDPATRLTIPTQATAWPASTENNIRAAAVSSFGFSGTNAHVILSEAPATSVHHHTPTHSNNNNPTENTSIWAISANSAEACRKLLQQHEQTISHIAPENFQDYLIDLALARPTQLPYRYALACQDKNEWLKNYHDGNLVISHVHTAPEIIFLFTGQGSQSVGMAKQLYQRFAYFRSIIHHADKIAAPYLKLSLTQLLTEAHEEINNSLNAQTAIFVFEYALAKQWQAWGINPKILIGHSLGEYALAAFAGILDFADALQLVIARARILDEIAETGVMLAVKQPYHQLEKIIKQFDQLYLSADNSDQQVVVAGPATAITTFANYCQNKNIWVKQLAMQHAFHTPLMQEAANQFSKVLEKIKFNLPKFNCISTLTGAWYTDDALSTAGYWCKQLLQPVLFRQAIELIKTQKIITLEVGPKDILTRFVEHQTNTDKTVLALASISNPASALKNLNNVLVRLYQQGTNVNWYNYFESKNMQHYDLPGYPFDHKDYWFIEQPIKIETSALADQRLSNEVNRDKQEPASMSQLLDQAVPQDKLFNFISSNLVNLLAVSADHITKNSNWFELGMDSLMFTQLASTLTKHLNNGREVKSADFYKYQTIDELISFLEEDKKKSLGAAERIAPNRSAGNQAATYSSTYTIIYPAK
jgi:acyl transferase domain-containing protein/acyl-CoA synthetase (AMP-forming)/AMP-acid ligase II